ncbi:TIR domain-containing protein [Burkholderia sp. Bp8963]|uniref:toll/interleukin-1 receptor domain-containing protein n=1 Tax=Burkholderia sp. Bp8963 TaxID=2184547 RepID=UPI000F5B6AF6|nr:toll/interleukin-1 receptor domain-containing protein [Burkholderia sp. Bp8963]RQS67237.1 TIR domain-containing protein [Burkholderia sp. Bp8963]
MPQVLISYAWESDEHKAWVRGFASRLVLNGVDTRLDQWHIAPGQSLTQFMESEIQTCDHILVICTKVYAQKSLARQGGVGYEQQVITGHITSGVAREKFIPIIRDGEFGPGVNCAIPPQFAGIYTIDMRSNDTDESKFEELLRAIYKRPEHRPPPLGKPPAFVDTPVAAVGVVEEFANLRLATIDLDGWELVSGVAQHHRYPETFWIPGERERQSVKAGDIVKLIFEIAIDDSPDGAIDVSGERMWVVVTGRSGPYIIGELNSHPACSDETEIIQAGDRVVFLPEHIIDVWTGSHLDD